MLDLGTPAPAFSLQDVPAAGTFSPVDFEGQPLLVVFLSRHCPYVKHIQNRLAAVLNAYRAKGVGVVAIGSNDAVSYPEDAPEKLAEQAREVGFEFPYLFDGSQEVARAYSAACTPDFFLFDRNHRLAYRGQFDSSRPRNDDPVTGADLAAALDAVLAGEPATAEQKPSMGCSIKWKEPAA
jgi:peroxiredoxin